MAETLPPLALAPSRASVTHALAATAGLVERQLAFEDIHAAVGAGGRVLLAQQRGGERKRARLVGLQIQRDHFVRLGNHQVAGEGHALRLILRVRHALHEIEIAAVTVRHHRQTPACATPARAISATWKVLAGVGANVKR